MTPDLSRQLGRLLSLASATPVERRAVQVAAVPANVRAIEDMPGPARDLIARLQDRVSRRYADLRRDA
jgi:hypothetical protein